MVERKVESTHCKGLKPAAIVVTSHRYEVRTAVHQYMLRSSLSAREVRSKMLYDDFLIEVLPYLPHGAEPIGHESIELPFRRLLDHVGLPYIGLTRKVRTFSTTRNHNRDTCSVVLHY